MKIKTPLAIMLTLTCAAGCRQEGDRDQPGQRKPVSREEAARATEPTPAPAPADRATPPVTTTPAEPGPGTEPKPAPAETTATRPHPLPKLELVFDGPATATIVESPDGYVVEAPNMIMLIAPPMAGAPQKLAESATAAKEAGAQISRQEQTADGWTLAYSAEGPQGRLYFVEIRRQIGDRVLDCQAASPDPAAAAAATEACLSLRPQ